MRGEESSFKIIKKQIGSDTEILSDASIGMFGPKKLASEGLDSFCDRPLKLEAIADGENDKPFGFEDLGDSSCSAKSWGAEMGNEDYEELPPDTILRRREMRLKKSQLMIGGNGMIANKMESEKEIEVV